MRQKPHVLRRLHLTAATPQYHSLRGKEYALCERAVCTAALCAFFALAKRSQSNLRVARLCVAQTRSRLIITIKHTHAKMRTHVGCAFFYIAWYA